MSGSLRRRVLIGGCGRGFGVVDIDRHIEDLWTGGIRWPMFEVVLVCRDRQFDEP